MSANHPPVFRSARATAAACALAVASTGLVGVSATTAQAAPAATQLKTGVKKARGPVFVHRYSEEFDNPLAATQWGAYSGQPGGNRHGTWVPSQASTSGGLLRLANVRQDTRVLTAGVGNAHVAQKYGKWKIRARADAAENVDFAFLLWPKNNVWPPEVDIIEGGTDNNSLNTFVHYGRNNRQVIKKYRGLDVTQWHTYGLVWKPGVLSFFVDGRLRHRVKGAAVPKQKMWLALQSAAVNPATARTPNYSEVQVDQVRIWRYNR